MSLGLLAFISLFVILNTSENKAEVKPQDQLVIGLTGPGQNVTNASVRLRSKQTGVDYYATYSVPQTYTVEAPINEDYTVYVCTNYPSHGSVKLPAYVGGIAVTLTAGECPYGD